MRQFVVNEEGERMAVVLPLEELRATPRGGGGDSQDEALLRRRVPGPEHERQAGVIGAGLDVWELIEMYQGKGRERLLKEHLISERQLEAALWYWWEHPEEIDPIIEENAQPLEYWKERYPDLEVRVQEF